MLRKTVSLLCLSAFTLPCYAGFYAGIDGGPETADFGQVAYIIHALDTNVKDSDHFAGRGVFASIFAGYGYRCMRYLFAGEINANRSTVEWHSSNDEYVHKTFAKTRYKVPDSFGISFLPGYYLSETLFAYARVGYVNGRFRTSTSDPSLANVDRRMSGFRYGVGVNQVLCHNLSARMEYSHVNYENESFFFKEGLTTKKTSIAPETSQVQFGLVYNFC